MSNLQSYIATRKKRKETENLDVRSFMVQQAEEMTDKMLDELKPLILANVQKSVDNLLKTVKKGDTGEKGDSIKGDPGIPGRDGVSVKGDTGIPGRDGKDGVSITGKPGEDGKDGSPDTGEEIIKKLNPLENVLNTTVIKGFDRIIDRLNSNIRSIKREKGGGGGGGAGNWITEAPSGAIDDSNTTFTLTNNPATQGKALILLYNGQVLEYGNQFTISGKTITTLFTPATGSYLFAMYMRS